MDFEQFIKEAASLADVQRRGFKRRGIKRKVERRIRDLGLATFEDYLPIIKSDPEIQFTIMQRMTGVKSVSRKRSAES